MVSGLAGDGVRVEVRGTAAIPLVRVTGELDLAAADLVRAALTDLGPESERVELDLAGLGFLDSSGLAVFIELAARVPVAVVEASEPVRRVIEVTGLDEVLGLAP